MPILIVLLLTAATARVDWPEPPAWLGPAGSVAATTTGVVVPVLAALALSRWAVVAVRRWPSRRSEIAGRYLRLRRRFGWLNLAAFLASVGLFGWGHTVWTGVVLDGHTLAPFAELLVPAPYLFTVCCVWLAHYDAERALGKAADPDAGFWSRAGHFGFNARPFGLLVLLPVCLFAGQQTFQRYLPAAANSLAAQVIALALVPVLFVLMPLLVKPVLGLGPMPAGPTRDRLEALARRLNFRCRDLLVWHTRGSTVNAMVVGVVPAARYVVFTDRLLDALDPDEIDAVFGHEVGHVKHGHIPYYAAFFLLSATCTAAVAGVAVKAAADAGYLTPQQWDMWVTLPPLAVMAGYVFVVFGFLSRKCERQADVYGVKAAGLRDGESVTGAAFRVSADGVNAMVRALERVAVLNGMDTTWHNPRTARGWVNGFRGLLRAWQHGTIPDRIRFLLRLAENPAIEGGFQWRVFVLRCGLLLALVVALLLLGQSVGWAELAKML